MGRLGQCARGIPLVYSTQQADTLPIKWQGIFTARTMPAAFTEHEYQRILAGGRALRQAYPDEYTRDGVPFWHLSDWEAAQVQRDLDRLCLDRQDTQNIACNAGRTVLLSFTTNAGSLSGVQYFAVGTGVGTPAASDTQLVSEFFRKAPTSTSISGGGALISTFFGTSDGNATYTEAGLFGDGATGTVNSGQLFNHAPYVYAKTVSVTLTNQVTITLT